MPLSIAAEPVDESGGTAINSVRAADAADTTGTPDISRAHPYRLVRPAMEEMPAKSNSQVFPLHVDTFGLADENADMPLLDVIDSHEAEALARFQIELIVDCSTSMSRKDCPNNLSRWQWCGMQSQGLAKAVAKYLPNGLTITTFSAKYDVRRHASPQVIEDLFHHPNFDHGTRLAAPLRDRLTEYLDHRNASSKPLLIVVITDGVPYPPPEPSFVENELIRATRLMKSREEVTVVFFQIGQHELDGEIYLQELSKNLVRDGARFRCVHTILFKRLKAIGLSKALVDVVKKYEK